MTLPAFEWPGALPIVYVDLLGSLLCAECAEGMSELSSYTFEDEECPECSECKRVIDPWNRLRGRNANQ